jgi:hypothetical protein
LLSAFSADQPRHTWSENALAFGIMRAEGVVLPTLPDPKVFDTLGKSPRSRAADHPWAVFPDTDDLPGVGLRPNMDDCVSSTTQRSVGSYAAFRG